MNGKKARKVSVREQDGICRHMLAVKMGQNVQVVFNAGGYLSGVVTEEDGKYYIGEIPLNGKKIKGVHLNNI